ncbi:NADPH-dependent FMN reductase [Lysobacter korlensis]|uniref:NADPH-dependent FMN reductase n=1 Tax=Lysobacter korlensis TaxID=553636 RepID=A0ABV6RSS5_9GAMM
MEPKTVLAICGSLRSDSLHFALLSALARRAPRLRLVGQELVRELPLYNPELDEWDRIPAPVREFRLLAGAAEAVVISSPEYLHAPSGVTKNALEWLVGSLGIVGKPALLMSASPGSTGGLRGLAGLLPTMQLMDSMLLDPLSVSRAPMRIRPNGDVLDPVLEARLQVAVDELMAALEEQVVHS